MTEYKDLKSCLRFSIVSFWLVQNLSLNNPLTPFTKGDSEGFPTGPVRKFISNRASGNDNLMHQPLEQSSL
jgi:hypothetical protein